MTLWNLSDQIVSSDQVNIILDIFKGHYYYYHQKQSINQVICIHMHSMGMWVSCIYVKPFYGFSLCTHIIIYSQISAWFVLIACLACQLHQLGWIVRNLLGFPCVHIHLQCHLIAKCVNCYYMYAGMNSENCLGNSSLMTPVNPGCCNVCIYCMCI